MNNKKQKSSIEWLAEQFESCKVFSIKDVLEQAKTMHKEEVKNAYISGYLDNGYYEGAEEDASELWEDTYGFAHNSTFGGNNED